MAHENQLIRKFYELAEEADRIDDEEPETRLDAAYGAVLDLVLEHPEARQDFADAFMDGIRAQSLSPDLICFCMHGLRWADLRQKIASLLETEKSERARHHLRNILKAFGGGWRMAEAYERFS